MTASDSSKWDPINLSSPSQQPQQQQSQWPSMISCSPQCVLSIMDQHLRRRPSSLADQLGSVGLLLGHSRLQSDYCGIIPLKIGVSATTDEKSSDGDVVDGSRLVIEDSDLYIRQLLDLQQRQFPSAVQVAGWYFCPSSSDPVGVERLFHQLAEMFSRHPVFAGLALSSAALPVCALCVGVDPAQSIACEKTGMQLTGYVHSCLLVGDGQGSEHLDLAVHRVPVSVKPSDSSSSSVMNDALRFMTRQTHTVASSVDSLPQLIESLKQAREFCLNQQSNQENSNNEEIGRLLLSLMSNLVAVSDDASDNAEIEKRFKEYELASGVAATVKSQIELSQQLLLWQQQQQKRVKQ